MNGVADRTEEIEIRLLLEALFQKYHFDFRGYAMASLRRRLKRAREHLGFATISAMQERLLHDATMLPKLVGFLTVQVSEMFRDPAYFRALREKVVPLLRTYPSLKVWVAGCSTGEEVYSLAILLQAEGLLERSLIYATDINASALERAQAGIYDAARIGGFTDNHRKSGARSSLSDYYTAAYGKAVFDKALKTNIVFADHSLSTDSAFSEVQLVSCRNVLIYFDRVLQDRVLGLFRDSLCRKGFLGLGAKESLRFSVHSYAFSDFVAGDKIFQKEAS